MATGYVRNDTSNNISDGNVIDAADFDGEFDAIQDAMHATSGHNHDGTTGGGGPINKVGPTLDVEITATELKPRVDNTVDLGTATLEYKDLYLDGTAHIDTLDVDENATITGTLAVTGAATFGDLSVSGSFTPSGSLDVTEVDTDNLIVNTSVSSDLTPLADSAYDLGTITKYWANAYIDAITTTGNVAVGGSITVVGTVDGVDIAEMRADVDALEAGGLDGATIKSLYEAELNTNAFTDAEKTKLAGVETGADVTDTAAVLAAGALMDAECASVDSLKAINQGLTTTSAAQFGTLQTLTGGIASATTVTSNTSMTVGTSLTVGTTLNVTGNITVGGTVDGYDVAAMGAKLAGIESGADVTDAASVNAAGAVMESDWISGNLANAKALDQDVGVGSSPSFGNLSTNITGSLSGGSVAATTLTASGDVNFGSDDLVVDVSAGQTAFGSTPSASYGVVQVAGNGNNSLSLVGTGGTGTGGVSWYTVAGTRTGLVSVGSSGNLNLNVDPDSNQLDPYIALDVKSTDVFRVYGNGIRVGQFATSPWDGVAASAAGVWAQTDGQLSVGSESNPLQVNRINSADGILINFRYDASNGGNITTSGGTLGFTQVSDERAKDNIVDVEKGAARNIVKGLKLKEFSYKNDPTRKRVRGFSAQEMAKSIPEAVTRVTDDPNDTTLGLNYLAMFPYITGALTEAIEEIDALEARLEALENA